MKYSRCICSMWMACLWGIMTVTMAAPIQADEPIACGSEPIRIGYFKLGYRYFVENGQEKGMNVDILEEIRKRSGCKFVTQEMSFSRIWADLDSGDLDISMSGIWSPERDRTLWCAPSITSKNFVVIGPAAKAKVQRAEDFLNDKKLQFGVVRGYTHGKQQDEWLQQLRQEERVEESSNVDILFEKLKLGRIDGMFAFPFVYRKFITELKMADEVSVLDWFPTDKGIIGCTMLSKRRFSEADADRWRQLIRRMQQDGTLKRIFSQYVTAEEADQMLDF